MNESKKRFVDQLLAADSSSTGTSQHYEKEMRAMFEKTLTRHQRREYLLVALTMGLMALGLLTSFGFKVFFDVPSRLLAERADLNFVWAFFLLTGLALLVVAAITFRAYWQGIVNRRKSNAWAASAGVAYVGLVGWLFLLAARYTSDLLQDDVRVFGLVLLVYSAVAWVRHSVARAEMRTAEKLLEIELHIAEIGVALENRAKAAVEVPPQPPPTA